MDFNFDTLSKRLKQFGQDASDSLQKVGGIVELKGKRIRVERDLAAQYKLLGEAVYEVKGIPENAETLFAEIDALKAQLDELVEEETRMDGKRTCPNCGKPVNEGSNFCAQCGAPLPQPEPEEEPVEEPVEEAVEAVEEAVEEVAEVVEEAVEEVVEEVAEEAAEEVPEATEE